ncbi:MAG: hypothetical protein HXX18_02560 [Bacteroidetes bacterium]|nr:hypothetical protein [Bacteroidota bacterium]
MKRFLILIFIGLSFNSISQITGSYADLNPIIDEFKISITKVQNGSFEDMILNYKGSKCVLTENVHDTLLKRDVSIIKKMQISVIAYVSYNNSASKIAIKLMKHLAAYRSGQMTKLRMEEWKKDTKACEAILKKMDKLPFASSNSFYWQLNSKDAELHNAIHDWVELSKDKLGI